MHLKNQIDKMIHTSNLFYNEPAAEKCSKKQLLPLPGMDRVFYQQWYRSLIEGAIKLAKEICLFKEQFIQTMK